MPRARRCSRKRADPHPSPVTRSMRSSRSSGWGLSLDYILTIAISAFFVPHYLAVFFPALGHAPGDVIGGVATIVLLAIVNIRGLGESAKLNIGLALLDLFTQIAL